MLRALLAEDLLGASAWSPPSAPNPRCCCISSRDRSVDPGGLPRHRQDVPRDARLSRHAGRAARPDQLRNLTPDAADRLAKDATGLRWSYDPDGCCEIRKVCRSRRRWKGLDASIGPQGFQAVTRAHRRASSSTAAGSRSTRSPTGPRPISTAYFDRARSAPPPARGAGLSVDRLRALHQRGQAGRRPARGPLARLGQGRMRHPRRTDRPSGGRTRLLIRRWGRRCCGRYSITNSPSL
jgi:hypothetical protein